MDGLHIAGRGGAQAARLATNHQTEMAMALPTRTPGRWVRPLKKTTSRTHMAKPVTAPAAEQPAMNTTNSVTAQTGGEIIIQRVTYSLAGQATAVRVTGDPEPTNNGLFYLHSDHLGSVSAMSDDTGALAGEVTRYYPFGDYRTGGQSAITDRGFTGHHENRDIGLTYMNARYYVASLGRFLSADTLVPDPANPQSLNRYAYSLSNPVKYRDPSGHCAEFGDDTCWTMYDRIVQLCPECRTDAVTPGTTLDQFGYNYQEEIFDRVQNGWRPPAQISDDTDPDSGSADATGIRGGVSASGFGGIDISGDVLFNRRSSELSVLLNANGTIGPQSGVAGSFGIVKGYNVPTNEALTGWGSGLGATGAIGHVGLSAQAEVSGKIFLLGNMMPQHAADPAKDPFTAAVMYSTGAEAGMNTSAGYTWEMFTYNFETGSACFLGGCSH